MLHHAVEECFDEGGLAWDDGNNNRAFLSQEISLSGNAPSIYVAARGKFPDVYKGMNHGHYPPGPAGRFYWLPYARQVGYAGPAGRKATEALTKYIMVDMFAKAIQGMRAEDAVAWASSEMKKIYGG